MGASNYCFFRFFKSFTKQQMANPYVKESLRSGFKVRQIYYVQQWVKQQPHSEKIRGFFD